MKTKILFIICLLTTAFLKAQTVKSYTGPFTVSSAEGTATYQYIEDPSTGSRVFNGKFSFSGKIGGKLIETIEGNYKNNLKDGLWVYNTKTVPGIRTVSDQKFSGTYKDGYPDGTWTLNSTTKFVSGTEHAGKSLTGTTITITGTATYKDKHLYGYFKFENKQTGDNVQPVSVQGNFDENGYMDGKWVIKWAKQMNGQIWEETREYKNGVLVHTRQLDPKSGEATNEDYSDKLKIHSGYDQSTGLYISPDNLIYIAETVGAEGNWGADYALTVASDYFCKADKEDHYHKNSKGCLGCSYFKALSFKRVYNNQVADEPFRNRDFKKAAKIYEYFIKADPQNAGLNYSNLSWTNCLIGNFQENITACKEGIKVASGDNKNTLLKNLAHSYLLTNQYEEAKKCYYEFADNDFTFLSQVLDKNLDTLKNLGFHNPDCDKMKSEVKAKIGEQAMITKQKEEEKQQKLNQEKMIKELPNVISSKHDDFLKLYKEKKEIPFIVDANGNPTYRDSYPKGKNIYEKGEQLFQDNLKLFNSEKENDKILSIGNDIIKLLDKLISVASTETKELDKQLKKAETNEDIKRILGF